MALNTPLSKLLTMLKAESRLALSAGAGINADATLRQLLDRTQNTLWQEVDWPHLRVKRDTVTQAGLNLYNMPSDMEFGRITRIVVKYNNLWSPPLERGIGDEHYNAFDPEKNQRTDLTERWDVRENQQIEIWPLPASDGTPIRFWGLKSIPSLVADSDQAALDDQLIVLFAAAEVLVANNAKDAEAKLKVAQARLGALIGNEQRGRRYNMTGANGPGTRPRGTEDPWRIRVTYAKAQG